MNNDEKFLVYIKDKFPEIGKHFFAVDYFEYVKKKYPPILSIGFGTYYDSRRGYRESCIILKHGHMTEKDFEDIFRIRKYFNLDFERMEVNVEHHRYFYTD